MQAIGIVKKAKPSVWIGWCSFSVHYVPIRKTLWLGKLDKMRSFSIIVLLYLSLSWYCGPKPGSHFSCAIFWPWRWYCLACLSHLHCKYMNHISIGISFIGICCTAVSIDSLSFVYLPLFCSSYHAPVIFLGISKMIFFTDTSMGKCRKCLKINIVYFVLALAQIQPKNVLSQSSCFDIEYWRSHRPFMSRKSK